MPHQVPPFSQSLFALNKDTPDATAWGQQPWWSFTPLPPQHTQNAGLLLVYVLLGQKYTHLRK